MSAISNRMLLAAAGSVAVMASAASADVLLLVDLSVANQLTVSATSAAASASSTGSDFTGVLLANFYGAVDNSQSTAAGTGDLSSFLNATDSTPQLFRAGGTDDGLNIWDFISTGTIEFAAGTQAFSGSATWNLSAAEYAAMLAGNSSGDIYHPADDSGDIANATLIGQWEYVPTPGAAGLLGLAGIAAVRRRR